MADFQNTPGQRLEETFGVTVISTIFFLILLMYLWNYILFQALLDATYVLECRLVNEDFPQDRSEKEITHLIGKWVFCQFFFYESFCVYFFNQ